MEENSTGGKPADDANEVKPHQCPLCPRSFNQYWNLVNHYNTHQSAQKRKKSEGTTKSDPKRKRKPSLKKIENQATEDALKKRNPDPEGRPDSTQRNLTAHASVSGKATGIEKASQKKRNQSSKNRGSKLTKMRKRTNKKDNASKNKKRRQCEICGKWFHPANPARHRRMHSGEKFANCEICSKEFSSAESVSRHKKTVHRNPFRCATCRKRFPKRNDLTKHYETTGHRGSR